MRYRATWITSSIWRGERGCHTPGDIAELPNRRGSLELLKAILKPITIVQSKVVLRKAVDGVKNRQRIRSTGIQEKADCPFEFYPAVYSRHQGTWGQILIHATLMVEISNGAIKEKEVWDSIKKCTRRKRKDPM